MMGNSVVNIFLDVEFFLGGGVSSKWSRDSFGMISVFIRNDYDRKMGCFSMLASTKLQHDKMISKKIA